MALKLYDTLRREKSIFQPLTPRQVKMYCCGITPYSNTHIGHTRTFFSYDLLYRTMIALGYEVTWARNITDVDDKIIAKAVAEKISIKEIVDRYVSEQTQVLSSFQLNIPNEPRVTETIPEIVAMTSLLIEKNHAYVSKSGVYFRVSSFPEYGKLSKNKVSELRKGARIEVDETKEDPVDFALWKFSKPDEPAEAKWDSPWGKGRPGWHIECSAMAKKCFGETVDIHMGGRDLIFPHHECEIAQSEAATGKTFANFWLHCGMVTLYGEKMSKSTGHFVAISDFLHKYPHEVLRLVFLSAAYAQPLDYTEELALENFKKLGKLYRAVLLINEYANRTEDPVKKASPTVIFGGLESLQDAMLSSLLDDLNSAAALAHFFEFIKKVNTGLANLEKKNLALNNEDKKSLVELWPRTKNWLGKTLGILGSEPAAFFEECASRRLDGSFSAKDIEAHLLKREDARKIKDWARADVIRDELLSHGIQIQDTLAGTKWTVEI